jgi:hypothetical protein
MISYPLTRTLSEAGDHVRFTSVTVTEEALSSPGGDGAVLSDKVLTDMLLLRAEKLPALSYAFI